jgi:hypothetical protein
MRRLSPAVFGLLFSAVCCLRAANVPACSQGAKAFLPCELSFEWKEGELPSGTAVYSADVLRVEFRSPQHTTYLIRGFWDGGHDIRVRFSPVETGTWTYRVASTIPRFDNHESTFSVADSGIPGFVSVANVRHWWTTNKQPHLWLGAEVPFHKIDVNALAAWLDARKHDGYTHVRGTLLTFDGPVKPLNGNSQPNFQYFSELDEKVLAAVERGFTLDLVIADSSVVKSGLLTDFASRDPLIRYIVARYGGLNVTWEAIDEFEDVPNARPLLKGMAESIGKYDTFHHPLSTGARATSWPLLSDGWMNYLVEASAHPELGAVEHQFTANPEIHLIQATDPDDFRHELWNCTTNGEYPSVSFEALQNAANVKAVQIWAHVMADTRHWELEPYFDVDGARATGLNEVEYLAYAQTPGIVEVTLPKHKYNPVWVNPITGEEIPLKNYRGDVFSQQTPDSAHDWVLQVPREGHKEMMLRSYRFESDDPPIQEPEVDPAKIPYGIGDPSGDKLNSAIPTLYAVKLTRKNRATRSMQYVWWGEIVASGEGARILAIGPSGTFTIPKILLKQPSAILNMRLLAINANVKAYEVDQVFQMQP